MKRQTKSSRNTTRDHRPDESVQAPSVPLMRVILGLAAALVGIVAFATWGSFANSNPSASNNPSGPGRVVLASRHNHSRIATENAFHWQWPASGSATYEIRQTIHVAPGDSDLAPESAGTTVIEGKLNVGISTADESSVTLAMQLSDTSFTIDPAGDEPQRREPVIEQMLNSNAGLLHLDRNGRMIGCRLPAAIADGDRVMLEGIFAIQFVLGEGSRWESEEESQGCRFLTSYQTVGNEGVLKSRQVIPGDGSRPALHILTSRINALPGPFWIESLQGTEKLECRLKDKVVCSGETVTSMRRIALSEMPEAVVALIHNAAAREALIDRASLVSMDETARDSALERQRIARLVETYQSVPASKIVEDLVKAVTAAKEHEETIPAMHALRDWLVANPSGSGEIAAFLATPGLSDGVIARIAHALELAGKTSPEAQTALASVISSAPGVYPSAAILKAVVAAGGVGHVISPDLMAALSDLATAENHAESYELSNAALFAMGSLARNHPELQQSLVNTFSQWLNPNVETDPENITTALLSLANARSEDPVVMENAIALGKNHAREDVRMAAIDLLSSSGQALAIEAAGQMLAHDPAESVRRHAITSLTRPETISPAKIRTLIDFLGNGVSLEAERDFAIASLVPFHTDFPEISSALQNQLPKVKGETAEIIRQALSSAR